MLIMALKYLLFFLPGLANSVSGSSVSIKHRVGPKLGSVRPRSKTRVAVKRVKGVGRGRDIFLVSSRWSLDPQGKLRKWT